MLLGLRSILPLSLSGVLAFLGLWWYSARKKGRLPPTPLQEGEGVAEEQSPGQGGGAGQGRGDLAGEEREALADTAAPTQQGAPLLNQSQPQECAWRPEVSSERARPDVVCEGRGPLLSSHPSERPEPEGEVGGGGTALQFTEKRLTDLTEDLVLSKDLHPALSSSEGPVCGSPPCAPWSPEPDVSVEEMNQVAAGVITDVVSLAVAEVLRGRSFLEETNIQACEQDSEAQGGAPHLGESTVCPPLQEDRRADSSSGSQTLLAWSSQEPVEDSSSTESDESSSEEDYPARSCPGGEQSELGRRLGTARGPTEALRNGLSQEEEEELAPGCGLTSTSPELQYSPQPSLSPQPPDPPGALGLPQTSGSQTVWEIEVPKHLVGRLIGKQGRYVSFLKESSGAKVFISTLPFTQEVQICHIEGTKEQVDVALDMIRMKFKDLELSNCYAPPPAPSLPALPITSWLLLPQRVTVEVRVAQVASGNYLFLQQHTHPTFHALRSLDQQMRLCYAHPSCPALPAPVEVGVICAGQMPEGAWWRAQVMRYLQDSREVEVRYVDYGGYDTVRIESLRQIRSDFVSLPFQGSEVILDNLACLPGEEEFSASAKAALEELTQGASLLAQVTDFHTSGIPLVQLWRKEESEVVSVNQALVERGFCSWINSP